MTDVPGFIMAWAHQPGPSALLDAARSRLERGGLGARAQLRLAMSASDRAEVGRMLPASWAASGKPVAVQALRVGLSAHGVTLEDLLVALGGPLRDRRAEARDERDVAHAQREAALAELVGVLDLDVPDGWRDEVGQALARWVLRRAPARQRAESVALVARELPREGEELLAALAARLFADAHALDHSRPLGRAVARFLAVRSALAAALTSDQDEDPDATTHGAAVGAPRLGFADPVASPELWRQTWASGNVACDAVSSQVLVLNLPLTGDAPAVALCAAAPGEPTWLSLRSLRGRFALPHRMDVFVCENPSVVEAAAAASGPCSRPLICTFGRPTAAVWTLLRGIAADARLHVRADGDTVGWSIVGALVSEFPDAARWRMPAGADQYEEEILPELLVDLEGESRSGRPGAVV